jgi:hypothetical protein
MTMLLSAPALSGVMSIGRHCWEWWVGELSTLVPARWRDRMQPRIEARVVDEKVEVRIVRPPKPPRKATLDEMSLSRRDDPFLKLLRYEREALPVWLFLAGDVLTRRIQIPRSVLAGFGELLRLEADRWTPYSAEEIVAAWRQIGPLGESKVELELSFAPLAIVERFKQKLERFDLRPSIVVLGDELHAKLDSGARTTKTLRMLRRTAFGTLALALAVFSTADLVLAKRDREFWRERVIFEQRVLAEQRGLEKKISEIASILNDPLGDGRSASRSSLLTRLTTIIPDTDWLTEVSIRNDTVMLRGYSAKPEMLLKAIESLAGIHDVALQGELAYDAKLDRQRFSIAFRRMETRQ